MGTSVDETRPTHQHPSGRCPQSSYTAPQCSKQWNGSNEMYASSSARAGSNQSSPSGPRNTGERTSATRCSPGRLSPPNMPSVCPPPERPKPGNRNDRHEGARTRRRYPSGSSGYSSVMAPRIAVVAGGTSGVGRATVRRLASRGYDVGVLARGEDGLAATAAEVRALGRRCATVPVDVSDAPGVERAADEVEASLGPVDVWVNSVAVAVFGAAHEISADE